MSVQVWNITYFISIAAFVASAIIMLIFGFTRNRYYKDFHEDELIKKNRTVNGRNALYFTGSETSRFIKKYVICKSGVDKYIICNYNKPYKSIVLFILCYRGKRKPFKAYKYAELNTGIASKVITIPKRTKRINIVVSQVEGQLLNERIIKPISLKHIKLYSLYSAMLTLTGLYMVRHLMGYYLATPGHFESFLNSYENYIIIVLSFVLSLFVMGIARRSNKKKAKKAFSEGGAIEYDFL